MNDFFIRIFVRTLLYNFFPTVRTLFIALYPDMPPTRIAYMGAVHAIDQEMARLVETARNLNRETIIIFQSDNGGSILAYSGDDKGRNIFTLYLLK